MTLETDTAAPNSKSAQKVEIQVIGGDVGASEAKVDYNDALAIKIPDSTPQETLQKLNTAITAQSDACTFHIDAEKCAITDGQLFVGSFFVVNFRADITSDGDGSSSISFFRDSGDDLAAAKFLGDVKAAVLGDAASVSLIALDASVEDMDVKVQDGDEDGAAKEKMSVMDALHSDDMANVEMDGASEQYLTQKLLEAQTLTKENTVDKAKLVEALLEADVLGHSDVAVVRAASLILVNLMDAFAKEIVSAETLEVISGAVSNAKANVLARRYLVRLLSAMASAEVKGEWAMAKGNKEALVSAVKAVQSELAAKKEVELKQREFADVDCAAVLKKLEA